MIKQMKKRINIFTLAVLFMFVSSVNGLANTNEQFIKISKLNAQKPSEGVFLITGYVVRVGNCPPCPKPGLCAPCPPDHIIVSENKLLKNDFQFWPQDIILMVDRAVAFKLNKKYQFKIKVSPTQLFKQPVNAEVISYQKIR